ncbi:hypothetical protein E2C01_003661 [Portunus trituberculatus]|uniref:Uncharacterized protein n=1 Tax=Portunus trituberculatus TaxID=210409 RepID=A0A5B7CMZ7_PORTR|nr:hypothetical protein [Portunus trituberculatus]
MILVPTGDVAARRPRPGVVGSAGDVHASDQRRGPPHAPPLHLLHEGGLHARGGRHGGRPGGPCRDLPQDTIQEPHVQSPGAALVPRLQPPDPTLVPRLQMTSLLSPAPALVPSLQMSPPFTCPLPRCLTCFLSCTTRR